MADNLGATVGSVVLVTSPQGELTPFGMVPKYSRFRVVGIFNSGFYDYDSSWAFTRLSDAQRLFGLGDLISVIEFKIDDIYKADEVSRELEDAAGKGFMTTNWMEQNQALFHALRLERLVTFITIGLIVFVAALNILISLIMMVMEKTKDIAVLMSMGTRKAQVRNIFIAQGVLIGVIGTAIGLVARLCHLLCRRPLPHYFSVAGGLFHRLRSRSHRGPWMACWLLLLRSEFHLSPRFILRGPQAEPSLRKRCATSSELFLKRRCRF